MTVVHRDELGRRLRKPAFESSAIHVCPFDLESFASEDNGDVDSIDIRLGHYFVMPTVGRIACFEAGLTPPEEMSQELYVPDDESVIIPAHHAILGMTLEFIKIPADLCGQILTRSSWARTFIVIATAPWVHPNYRGCLTLEIANISNTAIALKPRERIGQLVFMRCDGHDKEPVEKLQGSYMGAVRPEFPSFGRH